MLTASINIRVPSSLHPTFLSFLLPPHQPHTHSLSLTHTHTHSLTLTQTFKLISNSIQTLLLLATRRTTRTTTRETQQRKAQCLPSLRNKRESLSSGGRPRPHNKDGVLGASLLLNLAQPGTTPRLRTFSPHPSSKKSCSNNARSSSSHRQTGSDTL